MVASRVRNGSRHQGTLEIGRTTVKMALVFSSTRMAISMRVCGKVIGDMARVLTGGMKLAS
jgi:hypothetical protein